MLFSTVLTWCTCAYLWILWKFSALFERSVTGPTDEREASNFSVAGSQSPCPDETAGRAFLRPAGDSAPTATAPCVSVIGDAGELSSFTFRYNYLLIPPQCDIQNEILSKHTTTKDDSSSCGSGEYQRGVAAVQASWAAEEARGSVHCMRGNRTKTFALEWLQRRVVARLLMKRLLAGVLVGVSVSVCCAFVFALRAHTIALE